MKKDLLSILDLDKDEIINILNLADKMKKSPEEYSTTLVGKTLAMIFEKPSTRTRVSFEAGMTQLGGHAIFLDFQRLQTSRGETIEDTARVISRYSDIITARLFKHEDLIKIANHSKVPVINALTDREHPCQALADLLTIMEFKGFENTTLSYIGDAANNVCHSLMIACAKVGVNVRIGCPENYKPGQWAIDAFNENARNTGATLFITSGTREAVKDSDIIYTDVWVSMGDEKEEKERMKAFEPYQVNGELMRNAKPNAIFMHDLPAHRGLEVTNDVIDGSQSVVFEQAENRLHVQKALMCFLLNL